VTRRKGQSISSVGDFKYFGLITYACLLAFGVYLVTFHVLLVAEIILLVAGPILLAGLGYILVHQLVFSPLQWSSDFRGFGRFWLAFILVLVPKLGW
jgi:hypothetical protein